MSSRPDEFKAKAFDKLFGVINFASMSEKDQEIYESEFRWILNRNSEMATALEKGLNQGRAEGALEKALDTARKMKVAGIDAATICQCTELTMEQIGNL